MQLGGIKVSSKLFPYLWNLTSVTFCLIIGLRSQVGADWYSYEGIYNMASEVDTFTYLTNGDPGFLMINWIASKFEGGTTLVNLFCACVFMIGINRFCLLHAYPWISIAVAVPYLIVVVSMGYSRQSVSIGFELLAMLAFQNNQYYRLILYIFAAVLFHSSACILVVLLFLLSNQSRVKKIVSLSVFSGAIVFALNSSKIFSMADSYSSNEILSEAGLVRCLMNIFPSIIFMLIKFNGLKKSREDRVYVFMSVASFCAAIAAVSYSTLSDRLALYLYPIQMYSYSLLINVLEGSLFKLPAILVIFIQYAMVFFVWINYATYSTAWLPYKSILN